MAHPSKAPPIPAIPAVRMSVPALAGNGAPNSSMSAMLKSGDGQSIEVDLARVTACDPVLPFSAVTKLTKP